MLKREFLKYQVTDTETGEIVDLEQVIEDYFSADNQKKGFELCFPKVLYEFLNIVDSPQAKILVYLLKKKTNQNVLSITNRRISEALKINKNTTGKVMRKLQDKGLLKQIQYGTYLLHPDILTYGGGNAWSARHKWDRGEA